MASGSEDLPLPAAVPPATADFTLRLFGPFAATLGGQPLPRLRSRKEQHLLCLLALRAPRPAERLWLAGTLWPDSAEDTALYNLRRSLHNLRAVLGSRHAARLHSPTPATLALDLEGMDVDVLTFDAALKTGTPEALEQALALAARPLLEDCTEDWAIAERAARQESLLAACETGAAQCATVGDHAQAARLLRRALALDPLRETTVRTLMQSLAASGDTAAAMDAFRRFRRRLRRELDAAPAPETRALLGTLSDALSPTPAAPLRLPRPLTPLVGRRQEVRETVAALDSSRLVTLMGTGGVGKTRLAIAAAEDIAEETEVCFVALAALTDAALLAAHAARVLDIEGMCDTTEMLVEHLRGRSLLLVLDNCEHLLEGCASFVSALLEGCGRVRVVATSRQPLGVAGETIRPVPLLSVPPVHDASYSTTEVRLETEYESVELFVGRARAARASFAADGRTLPAIVRICRRLDGLPLALELAAARVRSLSCDQIADRLDDRFALLTEGNRGALARHQTLRAAVDWSYDLLTEAERLLLGDVSVFSGGWTLEAAEAICAEGGLDVLSALTGLTEKSLVQMQECEDGSARYFLLETLREYGQEKLIQTGQAEALRGRAAFWFLGLAESAEAALEGPEQALWLGRLERDHDNLRSSLAWYGQQAGSVEEGLRLAGALRRFWEIHGHFSEGRQWLGRALEKAQRNGRNTSDLWGKVFIGAGTLAFQQGDYAVAQALLEEGLTLQRQMGNLRDVASLLNNLGLIARNQGELGTARVLYEESLAVRRQLADQQGVAISLHNLGLIAIDQGDHAAAQTFLEESLAIFRSLRYQVGISASLEALGIIFYEQKNYTAAQTLYEESLSLRRRLGDQQGVASALYNLALIAIDQDNHAAAQSLLEECLTTFRSQGNQLALARTFESLASLAYGQSRMPRALRLLAAASVLRASIGSPLLAAEQAEIDQQVASAREAMEEEAFSEAWEAGQAMTLEDAIDYALSEAPARSVVGLKM